MPTPPSAAPSQTLRPTRWMAWLALALGVGLSLLGWRASTGTAARLAESRFEARTDEMHAALEARLSAYTQVLHSAKAFAGEIGRPRRADWDRLFRTLDTANRYPGITGLVYLHGHTAAERDRLRAAVRRDEPDFEIRPPGARDWHATITAVEPRTPLTLRAMGSDSWANPVRRETLEAARDSGLTRITPRVSLVIDDHDKPLPAFLMYQAVYRRGTLPDTVEERRADLTGFVGAGFRVDSLMKGPNGHLPPDIALRVFDGFDARNAVFFSTHPDSDFTSAKLLRTHTISIGGRTWVIDYAALSDFESDIAAQSGASRLLSAGLLVSFLLFAIVWSLATTRARAEAMALQMTRSLRESETTLRALFEQAPIGVALIDSNGCIIDCNDKIAAYVGTQRHQVIGFSMLDEARDQILREPLLQAIGGSPVAFESPYTPTTGNRSSHYSWHFQPVHLDDDRAFVLCFVEDINERKLAEARIEHLAHHDALTGLANRLLLRDRLQHDIAAATRAGTQLALLYLDLDFFKHVNDTIGHSAGDAMLIEVAQRLRTCIRESDTLARIGGDEFVVLLTHLRDVRDCMRVAEAIISAIAEPITVDTHVFNTSASVGIAIWPGDGDDEETLTRNADVAMYHAKSSGRNNYQFFKPEMNRNAQEAAAMERSLRQALAQNQFVLDYQPQVDGDSGRITGAEALIRWQHPELGLLSPARFIHVAEERGMIDAIGEWVLHTACRQARAWRDAGLPPLTMAVNVSARQFRRHGLIDSVNAALAASGLPADHLALEITESAIMEDVATAATMLGELEQLGVQIEIDDFGTGHSSLAYLKQLPLHRLKIDRSFVRDVPGDRDDAAIVEAIIHLARSLGLDVIAEGVETDEQRRFLLERGCRAMQGYHFARPLGAEAFAAHLRANVP